MAELDYTASMQQAFEYYTVDPNTWKDVKKLSTVKTSTINRDGDSDTKGSATFDVTDLVGECYIRAYLIAVQNGVTFKIPLGTFLVQTPSSSFNGKVGSSSMDAYTSLMELKENPPPLGYSILKSENIMDRAYTIVQDNVRAPVVRTYSDDTLTDDFVANAEEKWVTFISDLIYRAKYELGLDELGRILFIPEQDLASMQPVWTFDDDNSSLLHPDISMEHDIFGVPNVVEVVYSGTYDTYHITVRNDDPNSPTSTVNRGREIKYRDTNPGLVGEATEKMVQEYAERLLKQLSTVQGSISYTHGYCPVRIGDCVRLNYTRAGIINIKAKVVSQSIKCEPGCPVSEKAVFPIKLWG